MKRIKVKSFVDAINGVPLTSQPVYKNSKVKLHKNYFIAKGIVEYYITKTRRPDFKVSTDTIQSVIWLLNDHDINELKACIDRYVESNFNSQYAFSPINFFGNHQTKTYKFVNYLNVELPIETDSIESGEIDDEVPFM